MEKGITTPMFITVTLIAISIVCGVIFFGLSQSKKIANDGIEAIKEKDGVFGLESIQTIINKQNWALPTAACYVLLKESGGLITSLDCRICEKITTGYEVGDCFNSHMYGRVKAMLVADENEETYTAVISAG